MNKFAILVGKSNLLEGRMPYLLGFVNSENEKNAMKKACIKFEIDNSYKSELIVVKF